MDPSKLMDAADERPTHIGDVDLTTHPAAMDGQRQILLTNIERIQKTIELVNIDAMQHQFKKVASSSSSIATSYTNLELENIQESPTEPTKEEEEDVVEATTATATSAVTATATATTPEEKIKSWETKLAQQHSSWEMKQVQQANEEKPDVIYKSADTLFLEALSQQLEQEEQLEKDQTAKTTTTESNRGLMEERGRQRMSWGLDSIIEEKSDQDNFEQRAVVELPVDEISTNDQQRVSEPHVDDDMSTKSSVSFSEENGQQVVEEAVPGDVILQPETKHHKKHLHHGKAKVKRAVKQISAKNQAKRGIEQMSTLARDRLRTTYHTQSERGEEYYSNEQYEMSIACFNDAKFALLIIRGMPERKEQRESVRAVMYAKLRDQINSALLSERITDCHVQKFSRSSYYQEQEATEEDDFSHVNYRQAATMVSETKLLLMKEIEFHHEITERQGEPSSSGGGGDANSYSNLDNDDEEGSANPFEEEKNAEVNDLKDLLNEATLSLARIFSKQGCVYAKVDNHFMALDLFRDSIAAWEEAANIKQQQDPKDEKHSNNRRHRDHLLFAPARYSNVIAVIDDPLILETHHVLRSHDETNSITSRLYSQHGAHSLKNTTNLKALSTALQMARSHHALGVEVVSAAKEEEEEITTGEDELDIFKVAMNHHLQALTLTRETQRLRAAVNISSLGRRKSPTLFNGAAMSVDSGGRRLTTRGRDFSILMTKSDSKEIVDNVGQFMKRCTLLKTQQQVCISHASFSLGLRTLSRKWLLKALPTMDDLGLSDAKMEVEVALYIISVVAKRVTMRDTLVLEGKKKPGSVDMFSLYECGLPAFSEGYNEEPRRFVHFAMAALEKGLHMDAMEIFKEATEKICDSPTPPSGYYHEVLDAINAQIIIELKEGDMAGAVREMNRRLDIVSKWIGSSSLALAKDLHRLGCFYSVLGHHEQCAKRLEESLRIGSDYDDYDTLDSVKLLATTHDAMNDKDSAIREYECALATEEDFINKARLMNALSHLYIKVGEDNHLAVNYLEESLRIQQDNADSEGKDANLIFDTMILYGNAMATNNSFAQAIFWYESALNSNPDKSPIHPSNLRAWYNKGVTLFRNGDIIGSGYAFGIILDEVDKNPTRAPRGTASVLNAIASIYFANKDFAGACERFNESLSLKNDESSPYQRAGILCNIASAYYRMGNYEESEKNFAEALMTSESSGGISSDTEATIMCKLAYILYKRKLYLRAYNLFTEAASVGNSNEDSDDEFSIKCDGYAETCRLQLMNQNCTEGAFAIPEGFGSLDPAQKQEVTARKPRFEASLIPIKDGHNARRYSDAVYSWKSKMLAALGVELSHRDSIALPSEDTKILCVRALEYLLKQTEDYRAKYALEFEGLLVEKLNSKFTTMKSLFDNELQTTGDA